MTLAEKAERLRSLHQAPPILVLPNVWDAVSARLVEAAGFPALATTSAGVAASRGYPDGEIPADQMLAAVRTITACVSVPVTADLEDAYVAIGGDLTPFVNEVIQSGIVGLNIEDVRRGEADLLPLDVQTARIRALRSAAARAGVGLVINARTDIFLRGLGEPSSREQATIARLNAYRDAGADSLFVPGVTDADMIRRLVAGVHGPLNVLAAPASPPLAALESLGVARVSLGSGPSRVALAALRDLLADVKERGRFERLATAISYDDVNRLMSGHRA